jgi:DNA-binding transcriptional regulator YdaS (Cro superfamily)
MRVDGVHVQTLARAVLIAGSVDILALRLGVPPSTLDAWLRGEEPPPIEAFLHAVDIVVADSTPPERLL